MPVLRGEDPLMTAQQRKRLILQRQAKEARDEKFQKQRDTLARRKEEKQAKLLVTPENKKLEKELQHIADREKFLENPLDYRGKVKPGAGRPVGVPNRVTANFRDEYLRSGKKTPMEFLLDIMNEQPRERRTVQDEHGVEKPEPLETFEKYSWAHKDRCIAAAIQVAPYIHPKLSSVEVGGHIGISHEDALSELE